MAGTLTISTLSDGTNSTSSTNCIKGSARAWIIYNGTAQTITASFNVSSVTYNSTGSYTVNLTTAFASANFATTMGIGDTTNTIAMRIYPASASSVVIYVSNASQSSLMNGAQVCMAAFGS
jgi:hypothetical protein